MNLDSVRALFDAQDFAREVARRLSDGQELGAAMKAELAAAAVERMRPRRVAKMRAAGLPVPDDVDTLDADTIRQAINERTGLTIADWTPEAIQTAIMENISARLSDSLGVDLAGVDWTDADAVKAAIAAGVRRQVENGRATKFVTRAMIRRIRRAATWARSGIPDDERQRIMWRWYAAKYRRMHKQVWA